MPLPFIPGGNPTTAGFGDEECGFDLRRCQPVSRPVEYILVPATRGARGVVGWVLAEVCLFAAPMREQANMA